MDTKQAEHEIEWIKAKIERLQPKLDRRPSTKKEITQLKHQIRERELRIALNNG